MTVQREGAARIWIAFEEQTTPNYCYSDLVLPTLSRQEMPFTLSSPFPELFFVAKAARRSGELLFLSFERGKSGDGKKEDRRRR